MDVSKRQDLMEIEGASKTSDETFLVIAPKIQ
jgi:hypothetical protein